jgi:AraC-like DNA-binding protein
MDEAHERFISSLFAEARIEFTIYGDITVAPDWVAPPLALPWHLIYFVSEHGFVGQVGGQPIRVEPGSLLWVMPGVPRSFWIEPGRPAFSVRYFRVALERDSTPAAPRARPAPRRRRTPDAALQPLRLAEDYLLVDEAWEAGQIVKQIVEELPSNLLLGQARLRSLLILLFTSALRLHERRQEGGHSLSRSQRVKLARLAREHATDRLAPRDLAAELDLSPDYFARLFRKSFGLSPRAWLVDQRIRHAAAALVNSTRSVSQIAADFGYDDVFLFSRQFKQVFGAGPRAYRNAHGAS